MSERRRSRPLARENGIALVHVIVIGAALFGLAAATLVASRTDQMVSNNLVNGTKAFWIASGGLDAVKARLVATRGACLANGTCGMSGSLADGSYTVTLAQYASLDPRWIVRSVGTGPNNARKVVQEVVIAPFFDGEHGLIQIDGDRLPADFEDKAGAPGARIPDWTIDGRDHDPRTLALVPGGGCGEKPPIGGNFDPANTAMENELDRMRCEIVQRANECCTELGTTPDTCQWEARVCVPGTCDGSASCTDGTCNLGTCVPGACTTAACVAASCPIVGCNPGSCAAGDPNCATGSCAVDAANCGLGTCSGPDCAPGTCAVGACTSENGCAVGSCPATCSGPDCAPGTCAVGACTKGATCAPGSPNCVPGWCKGNKCAPGGTCNGNNCVVASCSVDPATCTPGTCSGDNCTTGTCPIVAGSCGASACSGSNCVTAACTVGDCAEGSCTSENGCAVGSCPATCSEGGSCAEGTACVTATCSVPDCVPICNPGVCESDPGLAFVRGTDPGTTRFDTPYFTDLDLRNETPDHPGGWVTSCSAPDPRCCESMDLQSPELRSTALPTGSNTPPAPSDRGPLIPDTAADRFDDKPINYMTAAERDELQRKIDGVLLSALHAPEEQRRCITTQHIRGESHVWGTLDAPEIVIVADTQDQNPRMRALSQSCPNAGQVNNLTIDGNSVVQGAGVLILPRNLIIKQATFDWKGLIVVLERGRIETWDSACGGLWGGMLMQKNNAGNDARLDLDKNTEYGGCAAPNNAFSINYSCEALDIANPLLFRTLAWSEVFDG